jgi:hypothetical protein
LFDKVVPVLLNAGGADPVDELVVVGVVEVVVVAGP